MKKKLVLISVIVVSFVFGFFSANFLLNKNNINVENEQKSYQLGWEAAKKRLIEIGYIQEMTSDVSINLLLGKVLSVGNNSLIIKITPLEPLADPDLDVREIRISENTSIKMTVEKAASVYNKELEALGDKISEDNYKDGLPSRFTTKQVDVQSLAKDQMITVLSENNVKDSKIVVAKEIVVKAN